MDEDCEIPVSGEIPVLLERLRTPQSQRGERSKPHFEFSHWHDFEECWRRLHNGQPHDNTHQPREKYTPPSAFIGSDLGEWLRLQNHVALPTTKTRAAASPEGDRRSKSPRAPPLATSPESWESRAPKFLGYPNQSKGALPAEAFRHAGGRWRTELDQPKALLYGPDLLEPPREKESTSPREQSKPAEDQPPIHQDCNFRVKPNFAVRVVRHKGARGVQALPQGNLSPEGSPRVEQQPHTRTVKVNLPSAKPVAHMLVNPQKRAQSRGQRRGCNLGSTKESSQAKAGGGFKTRVVHHLLDFSTAPQNAAPPTKYIRPRLGHGSRVQPSIGKQSQITVKAQDGGPGNDPVYVLEYNGKRPATSEVNRILEQVISPPSMLTCHNDLVKGPKLR